MEFLVPPDVFSQFTQYSNNGNNFMEIYTVSTSTFLQFTTDILMGNSGRQTQILHVIFAYLSRLLLLRWHIFNWVLVNQSRWFGNWACDKHLWWTTSVQKLNLFNIFSAWVHPCCPFSSPWALKIFCFPLIMCCEILLSPKHYWCLWPLEIKASIWAAQTVLQI